MTAAKLTVPARHGNDYEITRDERGTIRLGRTTIQGRRVTIVFRPSDALRVADGLVDLAEGAA